MKKYIALFLSFIMIFTMAFTMIPAAVGPAALAEDLPPEPTPTETPAPPPEPTPEPTVDPSEPFTFEFDYKIVDENTGNEVTAHITITRTIDSCIAEVCINGHTVSSICDASNPGDPRPFYGPLYTVYIPEENWTFRTSIGREANKAADRIIPQDMSGCGLNEARLWEEPVGSDGYSYLGPINWYNSVKPSEDIVAKVYRRILVRTTSEVLLYAKQGEQLSDTLSAVGYGKTLHDLRVDPTPANKFMFVLETLNFVIEGNNARQASDAYYEKIRLVYDYKVVIRDRTYNFQRESSYYCEELNGLSKAYAFLKEDKFSGLPPIYVDGGILGPIQWEWSSPFGSLNSYTNTDNDAINIFGVVKKIVSQNFQLYDHHTEEYDNDTDCYCNICNTPRHEYDSCTDVDCNRCGVPRLPENHDYVWTELLIWGGTPYIPIGWGHEQRCSKCGDIKPESRGLHQTEAWTNDQQSIYESADCDDCGAYMQRMHDFYTYYKDDPAYVCEHGGTLVTDCRNNCGYVNEEDVPAGHIYSNDFCDEICDRCLQKTRIAPHSYTNCADRNCNLCDEDRSLPGYPEVDGHVYENCYDLECKGTGCNYVRPAPVHFLAGTPLWLTVHKPNVCQEFTLYCAREGCTYTDVQNTRSHVYTNCADINCNFCGDNRTLPGYSEVDGHVYENCYDLECKGTGCNYERPAPVHLLAGTPTWVTVKKPDICQEFTQYCARPGCTYIDVQATRGHTYGDWSKDTEYLHSRTCSVCDVSQTESHNFTYTWVPVKEEGRCQKQVGSCPCGHSYVSSYDYKHDWSDCTDEICNDCKFERDAPGHTYVYMPWVNVKTQDICRKRTVSCSYCSKSYTEYDYTHTWSNNCTDEYCNTCTWKRTAPGHYYGGSPYWYNVKTSGVCREYRNDCTKSGCNYYLVVSRDTTHSYGAWTRTATTHTHKCTACGYATPVQNHNWAYNGSYYYCTVCGMQK